MDEREDSIAHEDIWRDGEDRSPIKVAWMRRSQSRGTLAASAKKPRRVEMPPKGFYCSSVPDVGEDFTSDEVEFMLSMDRYKRDHNRPFPDYRDILKVLGSLGYSKLPNQPEVPSVPATESE